MASKWINKSLFKEFANKVKEDSEKKGGNETLEFKWETPEKGTIDNPKVYKLRLLPDKKGGGFYKKMYYHMIKSGDKWFFSICPKTFNYEDYCPFCAVANKLYQGTDEDKKMAYDYKKKEKYVVNAYIINDPRDENKDDEKKASGKVKLYEFPGKVEQIFKNEMNDSENGCGMGIFDPGDEGYNFVLKVGSTKPQADNKTWPDYSLSRFESKQTPLADDDDEIEKILEKTYDLEKYLKSMVKKESDVVDILKQEMLFDLIETEYSRRKRISSSDGETVETKQPKKSVVEDTEEEIEEKPKKEEEKKEKKESSKKEDIDDEDLLAELENL